MKTAGIVILVGGAWLLYLVVRSSSDSSFGGINGGSWSHGAPLPPATPPSQLPPSPPLPGETGSGSAAQLPDVFFGPGHSL